MLSRTLGQALPTERTVLPFLYQTRTILRCYSAKSEDTASYTPTHPDKDEPQTNRPRSAARPRQPTNDMPRTSSDRPTRKRQERSGRTREEKPTRSQDQEGDSLRRSTATRDRERVPDVPFEGPVPSNDPNVRLQGTTITPKELAIFETLFRSKQAKPVDGKKPDEQQKMRINSAKVVPDFPAPLRALADEARILHSRVTGQDPENRVTSSSGLQMSEIAEKFLNNMKARMNKAPSDEALWEIMTDEVFNSIKALNLDDPSARSSMRPEDVEALARSLPSILLHFMSLMQNTFPGSSCGLALLPTLKKLGRSAFALGATTDLYNEHMQILYRQYSDLDSIVGTLAEMDKEVYEFNSGTSNFLQSIFQRERAAISGRMGPGMQALWTTDRKTRALQKLRQWDKTVQEQVRAAAIRKAREKDFQTAADMEDEQDTIEDYGKDHPHVATA